MMKVSLLRPLRLAQRTRWLSISAVSSWAPGVAIRPKVATPLPVNEKLGAAVLLLHHKKQLLFFFFDSCPGRGRVVHDHTNILTYFLPKEQRPAHFSAFSCVRAILYDRDGAKIWRFCPKAAVLSPLRDKESAPRFPQEQGRQKAFWRCDQTSSMMAISAASPRRGPILTMRV